MTPQVLAKLEEVFAIGGTDLEAIFYADISKDAFYDYQKLHPEFAERKELLREKPVLKARQTVIKALDNPSDAEWYLERKRKKEFSTRSEVTGADGTPIFNEETRAKSKAIIDQFITGDTGEGN